MINVLDLIKQNFKILITTLIIKLINKLSTPCLRHTLTAITIITFLFSVLKIVFVFNLNLLSASETLSYEVGVIRSDFKHIPHVNLVTAEKLADVEMHFQFINPFHRLLDVYICDSFSKRFSCYIKRMKADTRNVVWCNYRNKLS